jgi:hypothetical protein
MPVTSAESASDARHQLAHRKAAVEPAVQPLKGPLAVFRNPSGPDIKGREQQHEAGRKIGPHHKRDQEIENRLKPSPGCFHLYRSDC